MSDNTAGTTQAAEDKSNMSLPALTNDPQPSPETQNDQPRKDIQLTPASQLPQRQRTKCIIVTPLLTVIIVLLAYGLSWYLHTLEVGPEHVITLITRHAQSSANLLGYVQELQNPGLDHSSVRTMRDAASFVNLNTLHSDLDTMVMQMSDARDLVMNLGQGIRTTSSATHTELNHMLFFHARPQALISTADLQHITEYSTRKLADLYATTVATHERLISAHTVGAKITQSTEWHNLEQAAGATERQKWLGKTGLSADAGHVIAAVERCAGLVRLVEEVQGDLEAMLAGLREIGTWEGDARSPNSDQLLKAMDELRKTLDYLALSIKRT